MEKSKSILEKCKEFSTYPLYKAAAYVLIWKLFSIVPLNAKQCCFDIICEVLMTFVIAHMDGKKDIKKYTQFKEELSFHSKRLKFVSLIFNFYFFLN